MHTVKSKKHFLEPECRIVVFQVADIITTSDNGDWGMGEMPLTVEEVEKPWSIGEVN